MLIPLTRKTYEQLIPAVATGDQYAYCWGKLADVLKRALISAVVASVLAVINVFVSSGTASFLLIAGIIGGLYWFWGPVLTASLRNLRCRRYPYSGFWQGRVLDVFITEEIVGEEETVNKKGELVIVDSLEQRINLEVGDRTGFTTSIQAPLRRPYQAIAPGQVALMVVMSELDDLSRISQCSDIYIPSQNLWVSDYPYLSKDVFIEVSRQIRSELKRTKERPTSSAKDDFRRPRY